MSEHDDHLALFYGDPEVNLHTFAHHALAKQAACDLVWRWPGLNGRERLVGLALASRGTSVTYGRDGVQSRSHPYKMRSSVADELGLSKSGFDAALRSLAKRGLIEDVGGHHYCLTNQVWTAEVPDGHAE